LLLKVDSFYSSSAASSEHSPFSCQPGERFLSLKSVETPPCL